MPTSKRRSVLPTGPIFGLLLGGVVIPAVASLIVGIVALALWRRPFDIVFGVLILSFAVIALTGGIVAIAFLRRSTRLAEMQTDFIANVSHELRTPLAGMRLLVETLTLGRADEPQQRAEVLARIGSEVRRLDDLVARILSWRRLDSGTAILLDQPLAVGTLLEEAIDSAASNASGAAAVQIDRSIDPDLPVIHGDRDALLDAFRNLVHNAIKFGGDRGPIRITARAEDSEIAIEVRDHGPGIPLPERKRIFDRFYRLPAHKHSHQGTGLGLAIVRRVIESHRGRLHVDSEPGVGSAFIIHLPRAHQD